MLSLKDFRHIIGLNIFRHPTGVMMIQQIDYEKCKEQRISFPIKSFFNTTDKKLINYLYALIAVLEAEFEK